MFALVAMALLPMGLEMAHPEPPAHSVERVPPLALTGFRVHVRTHEDLDPDLLRGLAGEGVVLWLSTEGAVLRESTLESLGKFRDAYVQVSLPMTEVLRRQLSRVPSVGLWLDAAQLREERVSRLGPRRLAIRIVGTLNPELLQSLQEARPHQVEWMPGAIPSLLEWSEFRRLPGRKLVRLRGKLPSDSVPCWPWADATRPAFGVDGDWMGATRWSPPCGYGARVRLQLPPDDAFLRWIHAVDPRVEWEVVVGPDGQQWSASRAILERLRAATPTASTYKQP